jgi:hypothetical protein
MAFVVKVTSLLAVVGAAALVACGGGQKSPTGPTSMESTMAATTTQRTGSTVAQGASCPAGLTTVSGQANIFGAGSDFAPAPGGEGGGVPPPSLPLPEGSTAVTFPTVTGSVTPLMGMVDRNGPRGDRQGATDITSYGGISGIVDRRNGMFLVGVFLTDEPPATVAPKRLDFTKREGYGTLAPRIGQSFFVGDGEGRTVRVPRGATRLFLGFADGYSSGLFYHGHPGYYGNNGGHLCVEVEAVG